MGVAESNEEFVSDSPAWPLRCLPWGRRSRRSGGLVGECRMVSLGEIHLIQLALWGRPEKSRERDREVWGTLWERRGRLAAKQGEKGVEVDRRSWKTRTVVCEGKAGL